jgi:DNA-binding transcriptional MocR family regulator
MVLSVSEIILKERMGIILENKGKLVDFIEGEFREWFEWSRPNAGAIAFVKFKGPWTSEVLGKHLAEEAGISIKPAYCFADDTTAAGGGGGGCGGVEDYFRIGYGEKKIAPALEALREFVVAHEAAWRRALRGPSP